MILLSNYTLVLASKNERKDIKRFYKKQHYSARFLGLDSCYLIKLNNVIIASVIVSQIIICNQQTFIHALVVDKNHNHRGLATQLLTYITKHKNNLICFADERLSKLYGKAGFIEVNSDKLTGTLNKRFQQYIIKKPNLLIFSKS